MSDIRIPQAFPSPADVAGLRVVVTGGSRGLGRLISTAFARAGASVTIASRDQASLDEAATDIGGDLLTIAADVSRPDDNRRVADATVERFGGLDVWIANAGISPVVADGIDLGVDTWQRVIDVDLSGVFYGMQVAGSAMTSGGRIIVTGSVLGERPPRGFAAYGAAKAGVVSLAKSMALELGPRGITVNVVCPGWFVSPLADRYHADPARHDAISSHTALRRWGRSEDLPGAYLFLASQAASYVSGSVLHVDGGYLCS